MNNVQTTHTPEQCLKTLDDMKGKDSQANAKIQKVDKFTPDQIEKLHKGKMDAGMKK